MGPHVSAEFFSVLGASMQFGRGFVEGEDRPGAASVVVISHGLSQREFGDGASPIGRTIGLDGTLRTIVGVLPQGFDAPFSGTPKCSYRSGWTPQTICTRRGGIFTSSGVVAGLVGALGATRALSGLLFGVGTTDLSTFSLVPVVVLVVAAVACFVPARRASKVDPMIALRLE